MEKKFEPGESFRENFPAGQPDARLEKEEKDLNRRLEEKFNKVFEKENREGRRPAIGVNIFYSGHVEAEELEGLAEKMAEADIYIPETSCWTPELLQDFRDCAEGRKTPAEIIKEWEITPQNDHSYFFRSRQLEIMYGSRKAVTLVDIPHGHPLEHFVPPFVYLREENFRDNLDHYKDFLKEWAERQKSREEYMISQLKPKIRELLEENPALKKKEKLNVLLSLGMFHTGLWHTLKKNKEKVSADFGGRPVIFSQMNEAIRKCRFGLEVDDKLASQAMLEWEFMNYRGRPTFGDSSKTQLVIRKLFGRFDAEDVREIMEQRHFLMSLDAKLAEKGLKIPESEEETDELLRQ